VSKKIIGAIARRVFNDVEDDEPDEIGHYAKDETALKILLSKSDDLNDEDWNVVECSLAKES